MIDLRDSTVLVNNVEEYIAVTKIAKKQGFRWASWAPLSIVLCEFPTRLEFNRKYETYWGSSRGIGVNHYGVIPCNHCAFVREMKKYCGKKLRIAAINNFDDTYYYLNSVHSWTFTSEMFEKGDLSMLITRRQECIK